MKKILIGLLLAIGVFGMVFAAPNQASAYSISGYCLTESGTGIASALVWLTTPSNSQTYVTGADGYYVFTGLAEGNYSVMAGGPCQFNPTSRSYNPLNSDQTDQNFIRFIPPPTYMISGYARDGGGIGMAGVLVTLGGAVSKTYTTVTGGYYYFNGLLQGNYTTTPSKAGYSFSPVNRSYSPLNANQSNQDFLGTPPPVYSISGYVKNGSGVGISGVLVSVSGDTSKTYTTGSDGYYVFNGLSGGNYTVTPSKTGYSFSPVNLSYNPLNADQTNQNFTGTPLATYYIKGYVKKSGGLGLSGVTVTLSGDASRTYTTGINGYYQFTGLYQGNYTVTPTKSSWWFSPANKSYSPLNSNQSNQNYTGARN